MAAWKMTPPIVLASYGVDLWLLTKGAKGPPPVETDPRPFNV
jgi:hypothetical protein